MLLKIPPKVVLIITPSESAFRLIRSEIMLAFDLSSNRVSRATRPHHLYGFSRGEETVVVLHGEAHVQGSKDLKEVAVVREYLILDATLERKGERDVWNLSRVL